MKKITKTSGHSATLITAFFAGIGRALCACITLAIAGINTTANAAGGPVSISSIGGKSDSAGIIVDGRWTGQPDRAPNTASNKYYDFGAIESQSNGSYWDIYGANFGNVRGSVWVLDSSLRPLSNVNIIHVSWSDTKIRIIPRGTDANFRFSSGAYIAVSLDKTVPNQCNARTDIRRFPVVGIIQSRGFGQCTWFVANKRLAAGKAIPPTAFTTNIPIAAAGSYENGYVPERWDCLNYGGRHVAIITSTPQRTVQANGSISWTFTVGEMNATWNEAESSIQRSYVIGAANSSGQRRVVSGIGSNAGMTATGCYK